MKTKIFVAVMLTSLLSGILVSAISIRPAAADPDAIYINPAIISKIPSDNGTTFYVYVDVNITDLFGFDIKITWNNNYIIYSSLDNSSLAAIWPSFYQPLTAIAPYTPVQSGPGYVRYAAVKEGGTGYTGTGQHLFKLTFEIVTTCNFVLSTSIHFGTVKLSDSGGNQITATPSDGSYSMSATTPGIVFGYSGPTPPLEYGKTFQITVSVTNVVDLEGYNLVIVYDSSLLILTGVDWAGGVLGGLSDQASYTESPIGTITVVDTGGIIWTGTNGLLFTLTFQVAFNDDIGHIWHTSDRGPLHASITFNDATLTFVEGTITKSGISLPANLDIQVKLIQGDVTCDGKVTVDDLRTIAYYYDESGPAKYNLNDDSTIDIFDLVLIATNFGYGM